MVFQHAPFFGADIQKLGRMAAEGDWDEGTAGSESVDIMDRYVERLLQDFDGAAFRIGWDAGNGAAGPVIEKLTKLLPGEHHLLFTEVDRSEEHTSELQSLMRISYAVICLQKKNIRYINHTFLSP